MPNPNPLSQGLEQQQGSVPCHFGANEANKVSGRPSRNGRVLVGGHFAPAVQTALKIVAAQERTTV